MLYENLTLEKKTPKNIRKSVTATRESRSKIPQISRIISTGSVEIKIKEIIEQKGYTISSPIKFFLLTFWFFCHRST